jgi:hypothetical protein
MAPTTTQPPGRKLPASVFRVLSVPMRALLRLPFATPLSGRLMLIHHTGRTTGRHYRQPVSYIRHDGTLLTPGGGNWTRITGKGELVPIRGRGLLARPELVQDAADVAPLLAVVAEASPALQRFICIRRGAYGRPTRPCHPVRVPRRALTPRNTAARLRPPDRNGTPA